MGGDYLDAGTSLFETRTAIDADRTSTSHGHGCATLAAHVKHIAFSLEVMDRTVRHPGRPAADWSAIWRDTGEVTPAEWKAIQAELRRNDAHITALVAEAPALASSEPIAGAFAVVEHTAYHPGEIRRALCAAPASAPADRG